MTKHSPLTFDQAAHKIVAADVMIERVRQHVRYGQVDLPDGTGAPFDAVLLKEVRDHRGGRPHGTFRRVLEEEVLEAFAEGDPVKLREELKQVAATAMAWIEKLDREAKAEEPKSAVAFKAAL